MQCWDKGNQSLLPSACTGMGSASQAPALSLSLSQSTVPVLSVMPCMNWSTVPVPVTVCLSYPILSPSKNKTMFKTTALPFLVLPCSLGEEYIKQRVFRRAAVRREEKVVQERRGRREGEGECLFNRIRSAKGVYVMPRKRHAEMHAKQKQKQVLPHHTHTHTCLPEC